MSLGDNLKSLICQLCGGVPRTIFTKLSRRIRGGTSL